MERGKSMTIQTEDEKPRNDRVGAKRGWRKVHKSDWDVDVRKRLRQLTQSPIVSDAVKTEANKFLATMVNGRMPSDDYVAARQFIKANRLYFNKEKVKRIELKESTEAHAVFMACQACDNLREREIKTNSKHERAKMAMQVASAINVLSELQIKLIGGNDD
jgi:hypothetical protein